MEPIYFYLSRDEYGEFSNFARYPIFLKGKLWPTSEHYFQAQKFAGHPDEEKVRLAPTPFKAAELGRDRRRPLRADWESVKETVMLEALHAKFTQHESLRLLLLNTSERPLVEHTTNDFYWGDGGNGSGQNRLGQLLMQLRSQLRCAANGSGPDSV